ncbi:TauD/TfdA family dioxygenase [Oceanospirillum beijerinckii]|uniref:TauD/TfdA family dioxygenase n=1 Tax=Oceanospirillum beijerinckii TaxID=64976 RepID=UPI0003FFC4AC|nr:TauD/TfdA family dioxygenase [Oceanospirillum beijerinckii]
MNMAREALKNHADKLTGVSCHFPDDDTSLSLIVSADHGQDINKLDDEARELVVDAVGSVGAVLFRGFKVSSPFAFRKFAASFGAPLADSYEYGSTPRSRVSSGVYNSTEYPAHSSIPMHNEQAYTTQWPSHLWFHCMKASQSGGETPLADSRVIFNEIPEYIREAFMSRELMYVRNFSPMLDVPWQQVFNTESRQDVETFCRAQNIEWEWIGNDSLRTRQKCQSVLQHPVTGEWVWFNQAHLFHVSALESEAREGLITTLGEENLPRNVYYGDGAPIADADLDVIRAVFDQHKLAFPWQKGDVTMIDNLLVAHGRNPYEGERKVIVAMA